jgi:hypothetical protein
MNFRPPLPEIRWQPRLSPVPLAGGSQTSFQSYFDTYRRTDLGQPEMLRTFDLDF